MPGRRATARRPAPDGPVPRPAPPRAVPADLWTQMGFARIAGILAARAGLHFAPNRQPAAEAAMTRAMRDAGARDPARYSRLIERDAEAMAALLAEVTIGETYYFREPAQLHYIRRAVLPTFREIRSAQQPLRVWSAGCASGEEPYTLAILLREAGWTTAATVLGTDISRPRLDAARRARYTRWSLRGVAEEAVDGYFIRRGAHFLLRPEIRAMVDFRPLNLAEAGWPGEASGIGAMDVILCRNVLIYFDRATVAQVATRLLGSLSEDGWLFLGASDPMLSDLVPCETVVTGAGLAYRPPGTITRGAAAAARVVARFDEQQRDARDATVAPPYATLPLAAVVPPLESVPASGARSAGATSRSDAPTGAGTSAGGVADQATAPAQGAPADAPSAYARRDYETAATMSRAVVAAHPERADAWALLVRALANGGRIAEAESACASALERHGANAELSYLHAVLLAQRGQFAAAAAAARRALYLDRSLAVAHLTLGTALARLGHNVQAQRAFRAAEQALHALPADAPVPLADGESAHRLREAARAQRRLLGEVMG